MAMWVRQKCCATPLFKDCAAVRFEGFEQILIYYLVRDEILKVIRPLTNGVTLYESKAYALNVSELQRGK